MRQLLPIVFAALTIAAISFFASQKIVSLNQDIKSLADQLTTSQTEFENLENQDQYLKNKKLEEEIANIQKTYLKAVSVYESLLDLKETSKNTEKLDELLAQALSFLSKRNYASAESELANLSSQIAKEKTASAPQIIANVPESNTPPNAGYQRQKVKIDSGDFLVDIVSADMNSTRVIVDTASDSDCRNDCPVLSLADYVSRNGAFAGVNGSYFCPATYPDCVDKKNSFDTLLMNKNKHYFNSDNNVYSTVPAVIFLGNSARFVTKSLEWGRDAGVDGVIANFPLLVLEGQVYFNGDDVAKHNNKAGRSFVGATDNMIYIGVVHSATVAESAKVIQNLGIKSALNLDDGGSTALWSSGYKAGPGRNIPNAVLFVRK